VAPPRPHPAAPQTGGITQELADAQAKIQDKIVNALRGVDYVELKARLFSRWLVVQVH
jgi:hypothetical protein